MPTRLAAIQLFRQDLNRYWKTLPLPSRRVNEARLRHLTAVAQGFPNVTRKANWGKRFLPDLILSGHYHLGNEIGVHLIEKMRPS
jgi:hypothetical protein